MRVFITGFFLLAFIVMGYGAGSAPAEAESESFKPLTSKINWNGMEAQDSLFLKLPTDMIANICEYLTQEDVNHLRQCCKKLYKLDIDYHLWHRAILREGYLETDIWNGLSSCSIDVKTLKQHKISFVNALEYFSWRSSCLRSPIEVVEIDSPLIKRGHLSQTLQALPRITSLILTATNIEELDIPSYRGALNVRIGVGESEEDEDEYESDGDESEEEEDEAQGVTYPSFSLLNNLTDLTVDWVPSPADLPSLLEHLSITTDDPCFDGTHSIPFTNVQLEGIAQVCHDSLVSLTLMGVDFQKPENQDQEECNLVAFNKLQELTTSTRLGPLPRSLKHLTVNFLAYFNQGVDFPWSSYCSDNLSTCTILESLSLMYVSGVGNNPFTIDLSVFRNLTYLNVVWDGGHLPGSLNFMPPALKTARFQECTLSNKILETLPFPLESLELDSCQGFDEEGIASLSRLHNLTTLLVGKENITHDQYPLPMASVLKVVALENMNVRTLGLDFWNKFTDKDLALLKTLKVNQLSLYATTINEQQLRNLMESMHDLTLMRVSSDTPIDSEKVNVTYDDDHPAFRLRR